MALLAARLIFSRPSLSHPLLLNLDDLRIEHALDLVILDKLGKHLFGFYKLSRFLAAACASALLKASAACPARLSSFDCSFGHPA